MNRIVFLLLVLISTNLTAAELHVGAPKSVKSALIEITELFEKKNPEWKVKLRTGKSGDVGRLITQGAGIDVFLLSDDKTMRNLREKKQIMNVRPFLADDLVIIGAETSKLQVTDPSKLVFPELKAVALFGDKHPIGKAGREYLKKVDIYETVITKLTPKANTKEVIKSIVAGEVDWAIVYASDIDRAKGIKILWRIPEKDVSPQVYYIGSVTKGQQEGARLYLETLNSTIALKIFENQGLRLLKN